MVASDGATRPRNVVPITKSAHAPVVSQFPAATAPASGSSAVAVKGAGRGKYVEEDEPPLAMAVGHPHTHVRDPAALSMAIPDAGPAGSG